MWKCKKCGEKNEDSFDSCWSCGVGQDGVATENIEEFQSIKEDVEKSNVMREDVNRSNDAAHYNSTYDTTRMIAACVSFVGWFVVGISVLILLVSLVKSNDSYGGFALMGLFPAFAGIISGLLLVMAGQLTRATVDTADNTGQMLSLMKKRKR